MATRFYLPSWNVWANPYAGVLSYDASWEHVPTGTRKSQITSTTTPTAYPTVSGSFQESNAVSGARDIAAAQYISHPLVGNQTISGTITGQVRLSENNAATNAMAQLVAYVIEPNGTVRGVLYAGHTNALSSELATTLTNRTLPLLALSPAALSSVNAIDGDRVVIEIGFRKTESSTTNRTLALSAGTDAAADLAVDETTTTANNGWVELSQDLTLQGDPPRVGSRTLTGIGV